jgi:hypothetical protein
MAASKSFLKINDVRMDCAIPLVPHDSAALHLSNSFQSLEAVYGRSAIKM